MMHTQRLSPSSQVYKEEAQLLKKVKEWLEPQVRDGIQIIRINDRYHKGYSDLFINARGRLVCAELKDDSGTPTSHQKLFIEEVQRAGGKAGVCRSVKDVQDLIDAALYCQCGFKYSKPFKYCPDCGGEVREHGGLD